MASDYVRAVIISYITQPPRYGSQYDEFKTFRPEMPQLICWQGEIKGFHLDHPSPPPI